MKLIKKLAKECGEAGNHFYPDERDVANAYEAGFIEGREMAIDRVQYSRFSIVLQDDGFTRGYIKACEDIKQRVEQLGEEEVK
jgi:hypothetical protein